MFDGIGQTDDYDDFAPHESQFFNNNFVQRNANIMQFYKDHDTEKRVAFVKIRDKLIELAKANRLQKIEEQRLQRIQNLSKWDHYKRAKDKIHEQKNKQMERQTACKAWITMAVMEKALSETRAQMTKRR